ARAQARRERAEVAEGEAAGERVGAAVCERERGGVALHEGRTDAAPARSGEHSAREVDADDARAAAAREPAEVSRAAREVDHAIAGTDADRGEGRAPPALVEAGGKEPVHRVVARRDALEHRAHASALLRRAREPGPGRIRRDRP